MKIAIVDDVERETALLEQYVNRYADENQLTVTSMVFQNPMEFLNRYASDYDLVLLDVEMPGMNGIEVAKDIRRMDGRVVIMFITNMAQYAINGYEVNALDYVLKPVTYADFVLKMKKAERYIQRNEDYRLTLEMPDGIVTLYISDLIYVEVERHYLIYNTVHGKYRARGSMKAIEEKLLLHRFLKCNRCYLVNLKYVEAVNGQDLRVGGEELPISRNKKNEVLQAFARYVGGLQ
jgi:DNA-binding LytR/AlgR family response regulator